MPYLTKWVKVKGEKKLRVWKKKRNGGRGKKVGDFESQEKFDTYRKHAERYVRQIAQAALSPEKRKRLSKSQFALPSTHSKVTDGKDHYPIQDEKQARVALRYVGKTEKSPPWFSGSAAELKRIVRSAVKRRYPKIEVSEA